MRRKAQKMRRMGMKKKKKKRTLMTHAWVRTTTKPTQKTDPN